MYRLTNRNQEVTKDYKNKDVLLQALERENARLQHQGIEEFFLVEELDKKGAILSEIEVFLPFDEVMEELFQTSSEISNKAVEKPKKEKKKKEKREVSNQRGGLGFLYVLALIALAVSAVSIFLVFQQPQKSNAHSQEITVLQKEVKELRWLNEQSGKLETFSRFFLPRYFSTDSSLSAFLARDVTVENKGGQVQSVIMETIRRKKDYYELTYVVTLKDSETSSPLRVVLEVREDKDSDYGFVIIKAPKQRQYP